MIKKYWWIIGGGIIILMVLWWPKKQTTNIPVETKPIATIRTDPYLPVELPRAETINWLFSENINLPEIFKNRIKKQVISTEREGKIMKLLGINENNGYVDRENNIIGYSEEIKGIDQLPTDGSWKIEELKNKLKDIVEEINEKEEMEIKWTSVKYQKILYPRWIESIEAEAQSVEIRGNYIFDGQEMTTYFGESIRGIFNKKGKLLKINLSLIPEILKEEEIVQLINIDKVSQSPTNIYGIVDNAGIESVEKINITQAKIVTVYDNKRSIIKPYYWLEGNTYYENKSVNLSLLVKAEE